MMILKIIGKKRGFNHLTKHVNASNFSAFLVGMAG
jgi:hypothetical protein